MQVMGLKPDTVVARAPVLAAMVALTDWVPPQAATFVPAPRYRAVHTPDIPVHLAPLRRSVVPLRVSSLIGSGMDCGVSCGTAGSRWCVIRWRSSVYSLPRFLSLRYVLSLGHVVTIASRGPPECPQRPAKSRTCRVPWVPPRLSRCPPESPVFPFCSWDIPWDEVWDDFLAQLRRRDVGEIRGSPGVRRSARSVVASPKGARR